MNNIELNVSEKNDMAIPSNKPDNHDLINEIIEVMSVFKFDLEDVEFERVISLLKSSRFSNSTKIFNTFVESFDEVVKSADEKQIIKFFKNWSNSI